MENKKIIVALGGNAILSDDASASAQRKAIESTCERLMALMAGGNKLIISHGNGPQVGNLILQQQAADSEKNPAMPLDTCVSMTQGSIGYWMQNEMNRVLRENDIDKTVVSLITQVEVSENDPAFTNPTKPIGPFLTKEEAEAASAADGCKYIVDAGRGYRKVVPSPKPMGIVELDAIQKLIANDVVTISCGGGGVPVVPAGKGYRGVEAVIDKDLATQKLAEQIGADMLIILTGVDNVYVNFNKPNQQKLERVTVTELKKHIADDQFEKGSMLPKIESAISFVESTEAGVAVITSLDMLSEIESGAGTVIVRG